MRFKFLTLLAFCLVLVPTMALAQSTRYVYLPDSDDNKVTILDAQTRAFVGTLTGSIDNPRGIAISPDGRRVYVTNIGNNTVSVFDATTRTEVNGSPIAGRRLAHGYRHHAGRDEGLRGLLRRRQRQGHRSRLQRRGGGPDGGGGNGRRPDHRDRT